MAFLAILSGLLLYPCLSFHLFEPDEGRYAQIPREMLERNEWIVPSLQGEPYLDKPPLFYWLVMLSYSLLGFHEGAARLIPALAMHVTILAAYGLGRRIVGERSAFWGTLLLIASPFFLGVGRLLTLDGVLTCWISLSLLAAYSAQNSPRLRVGWWLAAALACGLGGLTKGPVALLLVVPPLWAHRTLVTESATISWRAWGAFFGVVALVNLPWYIAVCLARPEFAQYFLWQHNVQRFVEPFDHVRPVWYYLPIVLYGLLPLTVLAWPAWRFLTGTQAEDANRRCPGMGYLLLAGFWCVFFFSLSGCKLPTYILPAFVPLCLAMGVFLARTDWHRSRWVIGGLAAGCLVHVGANYYAIPKYAEYRSPMARASVMHAYCGDPAVPVLCFPRNVDSVAFAVGRSDLRSIRSKNIAVLIEELKKSPRTVVLFGHRNSPETLRLNLPRNLRMVERQPMGLCEMAVIERAD